MIHFSFLICSHRAPDSIRVTLRSVLNQMNADDAEVIVVNNGFSPTQEKELKSYIETFLASAWVSFLDEPRSGLGNARITGFHSCSGSYIVLLDDDNYIAPDFLQQLRQIVAEHPHMGGICPLVLADWETAPDDWLRDFGRFCLSYNASGRFRPEIEEMEWDATQYDSAIKPPGGGMIIHRNVVDAYMKNADDPNRISLSRQPDSLVGCEDYDLYSFVRELSLSSLFTDRLRVFHRIPAYRLELRYLIRLNLQMIYSFGILRVLRREERDPLHRIITSTASQIYRHLVEMTRTPREWKRSFLLAIRSVAYILGVFRGRRTTRRTADTGE